MKKYFLNDHLLLFTFLGTQKQRQHEAILCTLSGFYPPLVKLCAFLLTAAPLMLSTENYFYGVPGNGIAYHFIS